METVMDKELPLPLSYNERKRLDNRNLKNDKRRNEVSKAKYHARTPEQKAIASAKSKEAAARKRLIKQGLLLDIPPPPKPTVPDTKVPKDWIKRIADQAREQDITPANFLLMILHGETQLRDTMLDRGKVIEYMRYPTPIERQKAAETLQPYYEQKKAESVTGEIIVKHVIPTSKLDSITLDEQGRVIEDIDFDDLNDVDEEDSN
jgi:hypothetical protein